MTRHSAIIAALGMSVCLLSTAAAAQEPSAAPSQAEGGKPQDQDRWWEKSSLADDPVPEQLRAHVDADFSFSDSRGNTSGTSLTKRAQLVLRKRRFTNRLSTDIRDTDMVYGLGGGETDYHQSTTRNHLEYDLTKTMVAVGGVEYARNTLYFIDKRLTYYVGAGATLVETKEHKVALIGGLGWTEFQFMGEEMAEIDPAAVAALPTLSPDSGGLLAMQSWSYTPSKQFSIQQSASLIGYLHDGLGHLATFDVSVNVPVSRHLAFVPRYSLKDEANIYIEALGVKTLDRTFGIGIKLSY